MLISLREQFQVAPGYLNSAWRHPLSLSGSEAIRSYASAMRRVDEPEVRIDPKRDRVRELFARLINASVDEVALIPSSTMGENLVLAALRLPDRDRGIVTDALHFPGSLYMYGAMARRGFAVTIVRPVAHRIRIEDIVAAIDNGTRLIALSSVSATTGFQHDLKAICDLAHERGIFVYADIVQSAGASPVDVRATGVDFCACAAYKWLMADMGAGFLYVRNEILNRIDRPMSGIQQVRGEVQTHVFPFDSAETAVVTGESQQGARGLFEVGTIGSSAIIALEASLPLLLEVGADAIERHRLPLLDRLRAELPRLGFILLTPEESQSPIVAFAYEDARRRLTERLGAAGVAISIYDHRIRMSPSVFNDMDDIDRLLEALS